MHRNFVALCSDDRSCLIDELLSIFQKAVLKFCSFCKVLEMQNDLACLVSKLSDGDVMYAELKQVFIYLESWEVNRTPALYRKMFRNSTWTPLHGRG